MRFAVDGKRRRWNDSPPGRQATVPALSPLLSGDQRNGEAAGRLFLPLRGCGQESIAELAPPAAIFAARQ
jgi:hypothetical protein